MSDGRSIDFDHVVVACGAVANFLGIKGASEHSHPLYTLADARRLRDRLLLALEDAEAGSDREAKPLPRRDRRWWPDRGRDGRRRGGAARGVPAPGPAPGRSRGTRVLLVDVAPRLLGAFPTAASAYALRELTKRGVEVRLDSSVVEVTPDGVTLASGESIPSAAVIWAAGVTSVGSIAEQVGDERGPSGRVIVGHDLSVPGHRNAWAVGDGAVVTSGEGGKVCPQLAQVAIQSGRHCGRQILNVLDGRPTVPFHYKDKGIMATIGRNAAVAKLPGVPVIKGRLGWLSVDGPAPLLPRGLPQPDQGLRQLDVALLRLAVGSAADHVGCGDRRLTVAHRTPSTDLVVGYERREAERVARGVEEDPPALGRGCVSALTAPIATAAASAASRSLTASSRCSCLGAGPVGQVGGSYPSTRCVVSQMPAPLSATKSSDSNASSRSRSSR